jgi:hypothetical protein
MSSDYESPTGSLHKDISMGIYMDNHESQRVDKGSGYWISRNPTSYPGHFAPWVRGCQEPTRIKGMYLMGSTWIRKTGLTWIIMDIKLHNLKENI